MKNNIFKKIINFFVSVSLVYSQVLAGLPMLNSSIFTKTTTSKNSNTSAKKQADSSPINNDSLYNANSPKITAPQNSNASAKRVDSGSNTLNAQCLIYYDILSSETCKDYYYKMSKGHSATIDDLMLANNGDTTTFQSCLKTTCGKFPTNSVAQEETYPYIMETIKECKLVQEKIVDGKDLSVTNWFYNNTYDPFKNKTTIKDVSKESQPKIIPYKLLQYKCPSYSETIYTRKKRVIQTPVLCFKRGAGSGIKSQIIDCIENHNSNACSNLATRHNGINNYIFWLYCDQDLDRDGFYESLSPASQALCNRPNAASLRCQQDAICSLTAKCLDEENLTAKSSEVKTCKNIGRNFEEHIINTACGDQTDRYREDPNCIRINSDTDAVKDTNITLGFMSGEGEIINDYTEFVLYKKKANFDAQPLLVAVFFPYALAETKKGYFLLGLNVTSIAEFFGAKTHWESNGLDTIEDNLYYVTNNYCKTHGCTLKTKDNYRCWDWKKGKIIKKKYTRCVTQYAIWTEPIAKMSNVMHFHWKNGEPEHNTYVPTRIDYNMKIHLPENDILMIYNTHVNRRGRVESYIANKINTYVKVNSCKDSGYIFNEYKNITPPVPPIPAPNKDIHDAAMVLPHSGIYVLQLYDNDKYTGQTIVHYFGMNDGNNYPMTLTDLLGKNLNIDEFNSQVKNQFKNKVSEIIEKDIQSHSSLIDSMAEKITQGVIKANKYQLDNNRHLDYMKSLGQNDLSLLYNLLEIIKYEEMIKNKQLDIRCNDSNFNNYPKNINSYDFRQFDVDYNSDIKTIQGQYSIDRRSSFDCERTKTSFVNDIKNKLKNIYQDFDDKRILKLMDYVKTIYNDYQQVAKNVEGYLNKDASRYSTTTSYGHYTASFKSKCGDFQNALNNVEAYYTSGVYSNPSELIDGAFQNDFAVIKNNIKNLIVNHLRDETIRYRYYKNTRKGISKWDKYHYAVAGSYSCNYTYDCNKWNSCKTKYSCNCKRDRDGNEVCEECCQGGYEQSTCVGTASGSCYTHGTAITNPCTASCNGYQNAYYGSQNNRGGCDTSECADVSNDWDAQCNGDYYWFTTDDNYGLGGHKEISGFSSNSFQSWGGYSCDDYNIVPFGNSTSKCQTSGHNIVHNYRNTLKAQTLSWTSTAKKLNTTTNQVKNEINSWMRRNNFRDNSSVSPYITDNNSFEKGNGDNVRYKLATDSNKNTYKMANKYIKPIIKNKITELYRRYLTLHYNNLINNHTIDESPKLTQALKDVYTSLYQDYFINQGHFTPFNRIVIRDTNIEPNDKDAVNFDITLPGKHYIYNPNSFTVTISPHNEIRKYRCYTNWKKCNIPDNCKKTNETITAYVTDIDDKYVPVFKDIDYECTDNVTKTTCKQLKVEKKCVKFGLDKVHIDYDDADHSKEFYQALGKTFAINEAIKIFGSQELRCEHGLFTDFSWLQDPFFWLSALNAFGTHSFKGFSAFKEGMSAWGSTAFDALNTFGDVSECAKMFGSCLSDSGFGPSNLVKNMFSDNPANGIDSFHNAENSCLGSLKTSTSDSSCLKWADEFAKSSPAITDKISKNLTEFAKSLGFQQSQVESLKNFLGDPMTMFVAQIVVNLVFNTFDRCSQCTDKTCAETHKPKEAVRLLKLSNAMSASTRYAGVEYGLNPNFIAYNNCFLKEKDKCAAKFLGHCYRKKDTLCCYNSRLTRMLAGQMYEQLGYTYQNNGCSAIKLSDLEKIDFSACPPNTVPSPSHKCINYKEMESFLLSQINWNLRKTFDTSTVINAAVNAAKNME